MIIETNKDLKNLNQNFIKNQKFIKREFVSHDHINNKIFARVRTATY